MISSDTSEFPYNNNEGKWFAIRISRIISETLKLEMKGVRWSVMRDDDTVFIPDNFVRPLAKALAYGSDDRIQACMAEFGVPLSKEPGFHQFDLYGNLFGLLSAHLVAPLVSLHHLDLVLPIFPSADRVQALQRLRAPLQLDSAALMQQSICYDQTRNWTISVSWGYAVQMFRGIIPPREIERPARTFLSWYKYADHRRCPFNTRRVSMNKCQRPLVYCLSNMMAYDQEIASEYVGNGISNPVCNWSMASPSMVEVYKRPDPYLWDKAPRRNCCRILPTDKKGTLVIDIGACKDDEIIEVP
ncbi:hypothetical protein RCOM_1124460 [Ricinus communis]|uniref:Uncharacterized protein n=1 Tax=Ricinus communis TaxID=3988 RepID=B9SRD7_RICCO|nr:hypothetical protein RCOM_1124460 [Ricinus communis]